MTSRSHPPAPIAYDRSGPCGDLPVVLIHAGIADRRMWDAQWSTLTAEHDAVKLDLRGYGEFTEHPRGAFSHVDDVLETLSGLGIGRCHLVGASFGAGVATRGNPDPHPGPGGCARSRHDPRCGAACDGRNRRRASRRLAGHSPPAVDGKARRLLCVAE